METYMGYQASLADSGAQTSGISSDVCERLGLEPEDYLPTEMTINGATGDPLDIEGVILARVQVGRMTTSQVMYVTNNPIGTVLSKKALIDLGIISKDFPYQQQAPVGGGLRRPFSTMEAEAAKVTTAWNEMAMPDWGNVPKRTRSEKLAARLEGLRGQKRKAKHLGAQNFASVAMDEDKDVPAALHDPRSLHREELVPGRDQFDGRHEMDECTTLAKIDTTDEELVQVKAQKFPSIEIFTRNASEMVDFNRADPAAAGKLRTRSLPKHPSPGALTHSMDVPDKAFTNVLYPDANVQLIGQFEVGSCAAHYRDPQHMLRR